MKSKNWQLSRRTMLKGLGVSMALPALDVMAADKKDSKAPVRFVPVFMPNGVYPANWNVKGTGTNYEFSPILKPLESLRKDILLVSNLTNTKSKGHVQLTRSFLSGVQSGISIDQIIADKIGKNTKIPSMVVGTEAPRGGFAFSACTVSRTAQNGLIIPELNPQTVFDRLFRSGGPAAREKAKRNKSVVDLVKEHSKDVARKASKDDQEKIEQYLSSVRAVEKRLEKTIDPSKIDSWQPHTKPKMIKRPDATIPKDRNVHMELMIDLMVLAMWTDTTRVATLMMAHGFSRKSFTFLDNIVSDHHTMSHHKSIKKLVDEYTVVSRWHVEKVAYLLKKMKSVDEGNGSMLDNSLVMFGSGMKDGNGHVPKDLPIVMAGKAGGKFKPGKHYAEKAGTSHSNALLTCLQTMGVEKDKFGYSSGTLNI